MYAGPDWPKGFLLAFWLGRLFSQSGPGFMLLLSITHSIWVARRSSFRPAKFWRPQAWTDRGWVPFRPVTFRSGIQAKNGNIGFEKVEKIDLRSCFLKQGRPMLNRTGVTLDKLNNWYIISINISKKLHWVFNCVLYLIITIQIPR